MLDGTINPSGSQTTPEGQTTPPVGATVPQAGDKGTQQVTPQTYTAEEYQAGIARAIQETRTSLGREFKPVKEEHVRFKAENAEIPILRDEVTRYKKSTLLEELEAAKDNAQLLTRVQSLHTIEEREANMRREQLKLNQDKATWDSEKTELSTWKAQKAAQDIANKPEFQGISADMLFTLVPDGNEERLTTVAKTLISSGFKPSGDGKGQPPPPPKPGQRPPDSGITSGGSQAGIRDAIDRAKTRPR